MNLRLILPPLLITLVAGYLVTAKSQSPERCISVEEVRQDIAQLDGALAVVCGFVHFRNEDFTVYASEHLAEPHNPKYRQHCLGIKITHELFNEIGYLDGRWVRMSGKILADACPDDMICLAACAEPALIVSGMEPIQASASAR